MGQAELPFADNRYRFSFVPAEAVVLSIANSVFLIYIMYLLAIPNNYEVCCKQDCVDFVKVISTSFHYIQRMRWPFPILLNYIHPSLTNDKRPDDT